MIKKTGKAEKKFPVEKSKLTLAEKAATYDRAELEKLLDEYFLTEELVRKREAERNGAKLNYAMASKRTVVKNKEEYLRQVDLEQKARDRLDQISRLSIVTITEKIISYLPEKHVWYEATYSGQVYLVGIARTFFKDFVGNSFTRNRRHVCVDKDRERLVVVRSENAPKNPLDFVESHCAE